MIIYQRTKIFPIDGIYCSDLLAEHQGRLLSFGRLVRKYQALWIEINENKFLGFRKHNIIHPMARNLCLADPITIKKFNDTLHTSFVKHDIYQKIHYIHIRASYPLPTHIAQAFETLDELVTRLMHAEDKNSEGK